MSKALIKFIRLSPTKARLIARQVQGMNAELAMASLKFMPHKGAKYIANAISSAVANGGFEANEVQVLSCRVDAGAVFKRFQPRARGSASRIRKPTSHILVEVGKAGEKTEVQKLAEAKAKAKKTQPKIAKKELKKPEAKTQPQNELKPKNPVSKSTSSTAQKAQSTKEPKPKTQSKTTTKTAAEKKTSTTKSTAKKVSPKKTEKEA